MAEVSIFHTTGTSGDGTSPYTQTQVTDWLRRTFVNAPTTECVHKTYANALQVTGQSHATTPTATVATGAACIYGFPYENTAPVVLSITKPSIGTTGFRIVLRLSYAAHTVRVAILQSADGVSAIPAVTQSAGVTWEVSLATGTVTTGGTVAVTDTRGYVHGALAISQAMLDDAIVSTTQLADNSVTAAKIATSVAGNGLTGGGGSALAVNVDGVTLEINTDAVRVKAGGLTASHLAADSVGASQISAGAVGNSELAADSVDDTKAGNRIPQFYRRAGGSATVWSTAGTSSQTPTTVRQQGGAISQGTVVAGGSGSSAVTFPQAFSQAPLVYATVTQSSALGVIRLTIAVGDVTASGFNYLVFNVGAVDASNVVINWFAVGPE